MRKLILFGLFLAFSCVALAKGQVHFIDDGVRIRYDGQCFMIDGKDTFIYSGAFHYFRCPPAEWADRFQKIKDAGFNTVETYIPWNYSEKDAPDGLDDYTKVKLRECQEWIMMAIDKFNLNVIVRPGPYICAEWDSGGYPQWLMQYKPAGFKGDWLRSDDPTYLAWCKHWYRAVARALERFQISRRPKGKAGIIMFQLENEYDYAGGTDESHIGQIKALEQQALDGGIEVPFVTCWTKQVRGSKDPLLSQIMDCCNFYPRFNVNSIAGPLAKAKQQQPNMPQMVMELQGGWFSENGHLLAEDQKGINAAQINNLTLYCIQNGVTALNYYMLFGGTNFGDRTPPNITTSYDYFAPIREDGALGEKYRAVEAIGQMLKEYGPRFARSTSLPITVKTSDPAVEVALRFDTTGARILFVRNTSPTKAQTGEASFPGLSFHYDLPPFGSKILYVAKELTDANKGVWLPKPVAELPAPPTAEPIRLATAMHRFDDGNKFTYDAQVGVPLFSQGDYNAEYVAFHSRFDAGTTYENAIWVKTFENEPVVVRLNGKLLPPSSERGYYSAPGLKPKDNHLDILLENPGYVNGGAMDAPRGLEGIKLVRLGEGGELPAMEAADNKTPVGHKLKVSWTPHMEGVIDGWSAQSDYKGANWSTVSLNTTAEVPRKISNGLKKIAGATVDHLMSWYSMKFELPVSRSDEPTRRLLIDATGNGFLYLNGHPLGRFWQMGPQREYYLPEAWLNHGGKANVISVALRPVEGVEELRSAEVAAYPDRRGQ